MTNYDLILQDLQQERTETAFIFPMHERFEGPQKQVDFLYKQLRRAKSLHNRKEMLITAWQLGEVIETKTESLLERTICLNKLTTYYRKVVIKLYYIYEFLGVEHLYQSQFTTLAMISKLTQPQYIELQKEAETIAEARL